MHPAVEKELANSDKFRENLQRVSFWRFAAVIKNGRYCRESLDKAFALSGHTGNPIFDLWVYLVQALPWFVPATFVLIPGMFAALIGVISSTLSIVTMEPRIIQKTIEVPFLWVFTTTKVITQTVTVPVVHAPDIKIATAVAVSVIVGGIMILSGILKWAFLFELAYRRKLLLRHAAKTE
jgi:hypothetical protein